MAHEKNHDYHILHPSIWPFLGAVGGFGMLFGGDVGAENAHGDAGACGEADGSTRRAHAECENRHRLHLQPASKRQGKVDVFQGVNHDVHPVEGRIAEADGKRLWQRRILGEGGAQQIGGVGAEDESGDDLNREAGIQGESCSVSVRADAGVVVPQVHAESCM